MKPKIWIAVAVILLIGTLTFGFRLFFAARSRSAPELCINKLRQIDGAKQQWALENHMTTNDVPTWGDVQPYLKRDYACEQGGTYTLGRVVDLPTCSIGSDTNKPELVRMGHKLPPRVE